MDIGKLENGNWKMGIGKWTLENGIGHWINLIGNYKLENGKLQFEIEIWKWKLKFENKIINGNWKMEVENINFPIFTRLAVSRA